MIPLAGKIDIPTTIANNPNISEITRLKKSIPDALNGILMDKGEVRYHHPHSLPEMLEDLDDHITTFQRYLEDKTNNFSDVIDIQVVKDVLLFSNWKLNNKFSMDNTKIQKLISINDKLVSDICRKLLRKLGIIWDGSGDAWDIVAEGIEKNRSA